MRVGIDIGGTFTDLVALSAEGEMTIVKVPSTPDDPSRAFGDALRRMPEGPAEVRHGTTVATNAVLTRSGARLGLVTTAGFAHVLHLARQDRPSLYDLRAERPPPLVAREACVGVPERVGPDGRVLEGLDEPAARRALETLRGAEGVVVALLHAYANPEHEQRVAGLVREVLGEVAVSVASEVLPEFREYERTSTAALNAYVQPVVSRYLDRIGELVPSGRVGVMWSGGGVRDVAATSRIPVHTLYSGPAAGVLAAAWWAQAVGEPDAITLDMGGTSADVAVIDGGSPGLAEGSELDGLVFRTPCIDLVSVGAGGGSIGWVDEGGALRVGPASAGADPGPACYGRGGSAATVTDAQVVLGYLGGDALAGGSLELDAAAAADVVGTLGRAARLGAEEAAEGVLRVVRATMARAIRSVSVERGKDVRRYALLAFGGAGPLHATALARELGMTRVVVPPAPGALAAQGLLVASRRADASVSRPMRCDRARDAELRSIVHELMERVLAELSEEGIGFAEATTQLHVDCRYEGQSHELRIPLRGGPSFVLLAEDFHAEHRRLFGFARERAPVEAVTFRAAALGPPGDGPVWRGGGAGAESGRRTVAGAGSAPVYRREDLPAGTRLSGPALVTETDATTWLDAGSEAVVHTTGALVVTVG